MAQHFRSVKYDNLPRIMQSVAIFCDGMEPIRSEILSAGVLPIWCLRRGGGIRGGQSW
jgi:hypothetical protein